RRARAAADRAAAEQAGSAEERWHAFGPPLREAKGLMTKVKVLVADGDPRNLNIVTLALRRAGFEPLPASDGAQALRALQGGGVQAVVCDAAVADPGALELCRSARGEQGLANIPF